MSAAVEKEWQKFVREHSIKNKKAVLRKGSSFKAVKPWLEVRASPAMPTKMLSMVDVYDGWTNPHPLKIAKVLVNESPSMTFRELGNRMIISKESELPYIWWCFSANLPKKRAIHEDSDGVTFVKLNNKWQMAMSVMSAGVVVGSQNGDDYESVPRNAYFVVWENEEIARQHSSS